MRLVILLAALTVSYVHSRVSYEGFKVYRVTPSTQEQVEVLDTLKDDKYYDFWTNARGINVNTDVMVGPSAQISFETLLQLNHIDYEITIANVERAVQRERFAQNAAPRLENGEISFTKYLSYEEIQAYLHKLLLDHSDIVKLHNAGASVLKRQLTVVQISTDPEANKPVIFIDAGIHAREWIAPATALYVINELVKNPENRQLIEKFDWHILPLLNPDGYDYSQTVERMWRKNRSPNPGSTCLGVDLNRNFGDNWGGLGTSTKPCSEIYIGKFPFSEPESNSLKQYILSISNRAKIYLSFHSYGQFVLHPWGWGYELPEDTPYLRNLGEKIADAIKAVNKTVYEVGSVTQILSPGSGGSDDWAKSGAKIKYSYTLELPGGGNWGFDLPPSEIAKVVEETFEGVRAVHTYFASGNF